MSASNEWFEYHLTPDGWVDGSEKVDFSGVHIKEAPENRVLTLKFHEYLSSPFSKMDTWYTETWRHSDNNLIEKLIKKFGSKPERYGESYTLRT